MANLPKKPMKGEKVLQSIHDSLCEVIDYLPSLEVRGDNKTISVNSYRSGKTIRAIQTPPNSFSAPVQQQKQGAFAKVNSGDGISGYNCSLYENGLDNPATKTITVFLSNGGSTFYSIPPGTVLYVYPTDAIYYGG